MAKRIQVIHEYKQGVCVWEDENGHLLGDADGNFLSIEGTCGNPQIEAKMEKAARYWMGESFSGQPSWISGARKITNDEFEDQQARLLEGKVADPIEALRLQEKKKHGQI
jgi:hypothetical protein